MKYRVIGTVVFFSFFSCLLCNSEKLINVETYKGWEAKKQSDYFNALNKKNRMVFMKRILENTAFSMPLNNEILFKANGIIVYDIFELNDTNTGIWLGKKVGENYNFKGYWKVDEQGLHIWQKKADQERPLFKGKKTIILDNIKAESRGKYMVDYTLMSTSQEKHVLVISYNRFLPLQSPSIKDFMSKSSN